MSRGYGGVLFFGELQENDAFSFALGKKKQQKIRRKRCRVSYRSQPRRESVACFFGGGNATGVGGAFFFGRKSSRKSNGVLSDTTVVWYQRSRTPSRLWLFSAAPSQPIKSKPTRASPFTGHSTRGFTRKAFLTLELRSIPETI